MLGFKQTLQAAGIAALASVASAAGNDHSGEWPLFAYGTDVFGPVFYGDGTAYIGTVVPENVTTVVNVTFSASTSSQYVWEVHNNSTSVSTNWTSNPVMVLFPNSTISKPVQMLDNSSLPSGAESNGFSWYGHQAMFRNVTSGQLESRFWAKKTGQLSLWELVWNTNGAAEEGVVPVALKDHSIASTRKMKFRA